MDVGALAGLEPATCCLGDVSVQTPCRSAKLLVASDHGAKVIRWTSATGAGRPHADQRAAGLPPMGAGQWSAQSPDPAVIGSCSVDANDRQQPRATGHPGSGPVRDGPLDDRVARVDYDAELRLHDEVFRRTYYIGADDRVLDIGCGTGRTTRDAARSAREGSALGVDLSASMIERARELA